LAIFNGGRTKTAEIGPFRTRDGFAAEFTCAPRNDDRNRSIPRDFAGAAPRMAGMAAMRSLGRVAMRDMIQVLRVLLGGVVPSMPSKPRPLCALQQ
jgi:hypothetical protein